MRANCLLPIFLFFSFFPFNTALNATPLKVLDSLNQLLSTTEGDARIFLLINIAYELNVKDLPHAMANVEEALELAQQIGSEEGVGTSYYAAGYLYHLKEDYAHAEENYNLALPIFQHLGAEKKLSETYNRLGHLYTLRAEYELSLTTYAKALELSKKLKDDPTTGVIIFSMANNYSYMGQRNKAFELLVECKPFIQHRPHLINYYGILGDLYRSSGDNDKSLDAFFQSMAICEEFTDTLRMAYIAEAIAQTYSDMGNYESGAEFYFKTIEWNKKLASPNLSTVSYLGLGNLYRRWNDPQKALQHYEQALSSANSNQLNEVIPSCYLGMGRTYETMGQYDEALVYLQRALAAAEEWKLMEDIIDSRVYIAKVYLEMGESEKALGFLLETIPLIPNDWNEECQLSSLYDAMGTAYFQQGLFQACISYLNQGLSFAQTCNNQIDLESYLQKLAAAYQQVGNYTMALKYQKEYSQLHLELLEANNSKKMLALRHQFEAEERDKEIVLLQKEKALQTLSLVNQKADLTRKEMYLLVLGLLLFIGVSLAYLFFNRYKLKKKTEQLEYENRQIALEQEHLKISQQLEMAELRSNFFTDVSHEIRTPLSLILTPVRELLEKSPKSAPQTESYQLIHRNAERLLELVNQTLDFSKLENGHLPLQLHSCQLGNLLREVCHKFFSLFEAKQIQFNFIDKSESSVALCDVDKMEKAISNLLANAIDHSPEGGKVSVSLENLAAASGKTEAQDLVIRVSDEGEGVPAEHLDLIFERFYQVDAKTRRNGSGIGLALTKKIIELHEGSISVESTPQKGSTFSLRIPSQASPSQATVASLSNETGSVGLAAIRPQTKKVVKAEILLVEDNADLRNYLYRRLSEEGFKVHVAVDGQEALERTGEIQPELVISDVRMPKVNGFDLLGQLKNHPNTSHIPVVLLTAKVSAEEKMEGLEIGADDYLTKPFQLAELLVRSRNLIDQRRKLRSAFMQNPYTLTKKIKVNVLEEAFLEKAIQLVELRLEDSEFTVEKFCQEIGMSRTNLFNKLKALTGQNIAGFIRTIRLKKAADLIASNSGNIFEIAMKVGFNTRQSFNKAFKNHFGISPSAFKKERREGRKIKLTEGLSQI